jgi:hypothetical protein
MTALSLETTQRVQFIVSLSTAPVRRSAANLQPVQLTLFQRLSIRHSCNAQGQDKTDIIHILK